MTVAMLRKEWLGLAGTHVAFMRDVGSMPPVGRG